MTNYNCDLSKAPVVQTRAAGTIPVYYRHQLLHAERDGPDAARRSPRSRCRTSSGRSSLQDEWKVLPNLVVNLGIRYDDQKVFKGDNSLAFDLKDQWSPRLGFSWDFLNDGTSKLYGSVGRFHYATPTDLNVRVFTANTQVSEPTTTAATILDQDPAAPAQAR